MLVTCVILFLISLKNNYKFSEIQLFNKFVSSFVITDSLIDEFISFSGDNSEIHINKEFAINRGHKDRLMHGVINLCYISKVIGTQIPGDSALLLEINAKFRNPVYSGNILEVTTIVSEKYESQQCICLKSRIFNKTLDNLSTSVKSLVKVNH